MDKKNDVTYLEPETVTVPKSIFPMLCQWISVKDDLPPRDQEIDWVSVDVLVVVNGEWGHGHYDYDRETWNYNLCGKIESDDNRVTHWTYPPIIPEKENK